MKQLILLLLCFTSLLKAQSIFIYGKISDSETGKPIQSVIVSSNNRNTLSEKNGEYGLVCDKNAVKIEFRLTGYKTVVKNINTLKDTIKLNLKMEIAPLELNVVNVSSTKKADTVFGTWKFSVADYEFYNDKFILLTFEKDLRQAKIALADASQKILATFSIPDEAEKLYKDYLGYINVICSKNIYRITIDNDNVIHLGALPVFEYKQRIMPCVDTLESTIYFSNYDRDYPEFTYYAFNTRDTSYAPIKKVYDKQALDSYNMEYYFLNTKDKLTARKIAQEYKVDYHRVAAIMSGVTHSMFYTPLYAPLFIINDTVCIFDHYSNAIFKYNRQNQLLDSVPIEYHHPKNWKEWKNKLIADEITKEVYAIYQKNGFFYLKKIDIKGGKIVSSYKLTNQYVDKIKIKNGSVYYVYRPFESLQQRFIYKELINNL